MNAPSVNVNVNGAVINPPYGALRGKIKKQSIVHVDAHSWNPPGACIARASRGGATDVDIPRAQRHHGRADGRQQQEEDDMCRQPQPRARRGAMHLQRSIDALTDPRDRGNARGSRYTEAYSLRRAMEMRGETNDASQGHEISCTCTCQWSLISYENHMHTCVS